LLFGKPKLLELTEIFMSIENKATVLDEDFSQTGLQLKEDVRNLEDPEALQEEFLSRGYDKNTWLEVVKYYNDGGTLPDADNTKRKVDKVEARLHKIYPEKYFLEEFETDEINEIYSITCSMRGRPDAQKLPFSFHDKIPDLTDLDAVVIDHSILRSIIEKTDKIKLEDCDDLEERLKPLKRTLDEVYDDIDVVNCGYLEEDMKDCISKSTAVSWKKPLEFLDELEKLRREEEVDIDIRHPDDLKTRALWHALDYTNHNVLQEFKIINTLNEISQELPVSEYDIGKDDEAIAETAAEDYDKFLVLTYDNDFIDNLRYDNLWDLLEENKSKFQEIEEEKDCEIIPMLPSCAYSIFEPLAKEGYI